MRHEAKLHSIISANIVLAELSHMANPKSRE